MLSKILSSISDLAEPIIAKFERMAETFVMFLFLFFLIKKINGFKIHIHGLNIYNSIGVYQKYLHSLHTLYKRSLETAKFYKSWQTKLLNNEINSKRKTIIYLESITKSMENDWTVFRIFDRFRINNDISPCDPDLVIHNYCDIVLEPRVKFLLAFGLDFCLPIFKLDFYKYYSAFENMLNSIRTLNPSKFKDVSKKVKEIANRHFHVFNPRKVFSSIVSHKDLKLLKQFGSNKDIVICKPDKGRAVVILNKTQYIKSVTESISNPSKFQQIFEPIEQFTTRIEDRINRFLLKLKKLDLISNDSYRKLFASGTGPGILYGLPKIHKSNFSVNFPFRPIFAAYNTASYNIAKFLVPVLAPLTTNQFTIINSYSFSHEISDLKNAQSHVMASFDVESLFTNIPLHETIDICLNQLFKDTSSVLNLTKDFFKELLRLAVLNTFFLFNDKFYEQIEGLGMGLPLGPTFANIFLSFHEKVWLEDCPPSFKPSFYRRYVDDTFLLFTNKLHIEPFLNYLNSKHPNIKFTSECESDNKINFLDLTIHKSNNSFHCSIYRKPTFTGLGTSFFSFTPLSFKLTAIKSLIHRAYHLCSNYTNIHIEFNFLQNFFKSNGYPILLVNKYINRFLRPIYTEIPLVHNVPKLPFYISLPFFGYQSEKLKSELLSILPKNYPHVDFHIILSNPFKLSSFFPFKDRISKSMSASVIYEFSCVLGSTPVSYIGSTKRQLYRRVAEHAGKSFRSNNPLSNPPHSSIRQHTNSCKCQITLSNFAIIGSAKSDIELRILESIHIYKKRPSLNDRLSSYPLAILN
ncbi:hypothetical protein GQR58_022937 [Nymphon striatum]|nr:hypothetical protein GQR58_022937 [Nymphon striatum]